MSYSSGKMVYPSDSEIVADEDEISDSADGITPQVVYQFFVCFTNDTVLFYLHTPYVVLFFVE